MNTSESILQQLRDTYFSTVAINNNQTAKGRGQRSKVDTADATLMASYPEHDNPLGLKGAQIGISLSSNYNQKDVKNMIPPFCNANGDKTADPPIFHKGDNVTIGQNHTCYYGFRNPADNKTLIDSVAMNTVVRDWNKLSL